MIKRVSYCFVILTVLLLMSSSSDGELAYITVRIANIENTNGLIELGLYNSAEQFPNVGEAYLMKRIKPTGKVLTYKFKHIKSGNYAFCIYHDQNGDEKCNKNLIGVPIEPYAFSNNFRPRFSKPKFLDCSFFIKEGKTITINMVN
jgi:uncharacterized protein (DUF2141 family)